MINTKGMILIKGQDTIQSDLTHDRFRRSSFARLAGERICRNKDTAYYFQMDTEEGDFIFVLAFLEGKIKETYIYNCSRYLGGAEDQGDPHVERERKQRHDLLLLRDLGSGPYAFNWGKIESLDGSPKKGISKIRIRYY